MITDMAREGERLLARQKAFEDKELGGNRSISEAGSVLYCGAYELLEAVACVEAKTADDCILQLAVVNETIEDLTENEHDEHFSRVLRRRIERCLYSVQNFLAEQAQIPPGDWKAVRDMMPPCRNPWHDPATLKAASDREDAQDEGARS